MEDEWEFQRIRRFMDEQAAMPASSVSYMNAADLIRQLAATPRRICSTMASEVAATNSRLKAPAAAVELQPVQQSPSITSYMASQPSMNTSFEVPAADQLIVQQTVPAPSFTELVVQASSCVEEIRHDVQQDVAMIPAKHAPKRYKMSSSAEKLFNHPTVATSLTEADQAHGIPSERSGKAVYRKQLQQLQTDHEEPNLELSLGNGHLHNVDVQGRTFLYSKAQEMQRQRAAAAYPISCHIPVEVPLLSPNEFGYRVESRGGVLQQAPLAFCRPTAAAPPPIIGSTSTTTKAPPHQNCSPATTTVSYATIIAHPVYRAIMGAMASRPRPRPRPPLMMMSSMGPPRLPETLGPTAAQAQRSVISTPFPPGRPLPYLPGDVSLCKYYVHFLLLELLQLFTSHQIRTGADRRLCIPLSFHVVMIQPGMYVVMSFVLVSNM
jgi:hypothetical protein